MSHVFHRHTRTELPYASRGDGAYIIDTKGKSYLDASGGAAVSCLGHNHPAVIDAIKTQLDKIPYAHSSFFTTEVLETLGSELTEAAPTNLDHVYLVSGGSEAIEAGLKLALQHAREIGQNKKQVFIARRQSYHGNTLGALSVGGNIWRRQQFKELLINSHHIAPCYAYRDQNEDESVGEYGQRVANELEEKIETLGAETILAFVAEPVVGATLGAVPAVPGYFKRIREICDHFGILLFLDEVMCGMGRTGSLFACEQEGISADMIAVAKGLGAGYQAIGGLLVSSRIYESIRQGSGFFQHGHTYMGHASASAASLAVLRILRQSQTLTNVQNMGTLLINGLRDRFAIHPHIGDIRGRGLFIGIELVQDKVNKTSFPVASQIHTVFKMAAMDAGLMTYPMSGTIDGKNGHHILLAPPFIINSKHVSEIIDKFEIALVSAVKHGLEN